VGNIRAAKPDATKKREKMNKSTLGLRLRHLRELKGLTLKQFATDLSCDPGYLSKLENGKVEAPSDRFLVNVSMVLKVRSEWLRTGQGPLFDPGDEPTRVALCGWSARRISSIVQVLPDLPEALATDLVLGYLLGPKSLQEMQEVWHDIPGFGDLPYPARLFWNDAFFRLQFCKSRGSEPGPQKKGLDKDSDYCNYEGVKTELQRLLDQVRRLTEERGERAALATFLGVPRPRISEWLSGRYEPGGQITLKLARWVEQQERKTRGPGAISSAPEPKTRSKKGSNENIPKRPES
jgi:transcriptional regulator with XRE-family HTH domain